MRTYILKRLLLSVVILFFVMLIIFTIMRSVPSSYFEKIARERSNMPGARPYHELLKELNEAYGFDKPIYVGFFKWLGDAVTGKFGVSWHYGIPVVDKFKSVIGYTLVLNLITMAAQFAIAIPLGVISARKQYSRTDYAVTVFALIGISLPGFYFASLLKYVFAINLGWFELFGTISRNHDRMTAFGQLMDIGWHFVLPVVTLTLVSVGSLMRFTRTNMLEVLNADYIRTARAKGLKESKVVNRHAFRNTLIPVITMVGGMIPGLFSGAMITEDLFKIPGIGYTFRQAVTLGDIPFAMFYLAFTAALTLIGTLIADILYAVVDPRVRVA